MSIAAAGFALFIRDCCGGDLVGWIDARLALADLGSDHPRRGRVMRDAVLGPLCEITGSGPKLWSMILADVLLAADLDRERWAAAGASFTVVDSLVHNLLHRSDVINAFGKAHPYGPACYAGNGCAEAVERIAAMVDSRSYGADYPATFPRLVSRALWLFAAADGLDICNSNRIDDTVGCRQRFCPAFGQCARLPLR